MNQPSPPPTSTGNQASRPSRTGEVARMAYLRAMGVDSHVSRRPLPGAAPTRRLALQKPVLEPSAPPPVVGAPAAQRPEGAAVADLLGSVAATSKPAAAAEPSPQRAAAAPQDVERFSLVTLQMAGWLWLEETPPGDPGEAYWQLASAIGVALAGPECRLQRGRFDWPLHRSAQLDAGAGAASAALQAFLQRRLEQPACTGLVVLGDATQARLTGCELRDGPRIATVAIAEMLRDPGLKRTAWRDLQVVRGSS